MDRDNISIQTIIGVIFVIAALAIVPAVISVLTESVDNQVTTKSLVEEASYIIYKDGDYTCLKNGTTGRIESRSIDDVAVLQSAMLLGGTVVICEGDYSGPGVVSLSSHSKVMGNGNVQFDDIVVKISAQNNVTVSGLSLTGGVAGSTSTFESMFNISNSNDIIVEDVDLVNVEKTAYAAFAIQVLGTNSTENITVRDCQILYPQTTGVLLHGYGIDDSYIRHVTLDNIYVIGAGLVDRYNEWSVGFDLAESPDVDDILVVDCTAEYCYESGFHTESSANITNMRIQNCISNYNGQKAVPSFGNGFMIVGDTHLINCVAIGNQNKNPAMTNRGCGVHVDYGDKVVIQGCRLENNTGRSIYLANHQSADTRIINNYIWTGANEGIFIESGVANALISENVIYNATKGVSVASSAVVANNQIHTASSGVTFAVYPMTTSNHVLIDGNYFYGAYIGVNSLGDNVTITSNQFFGSVAHSVYVGAAAYGTLIADNYLDKAVSLAAGHTKTVMRDNIGWVTNSNGMTTITGAVNEVTVTHGLGTTPTGVVAVAGITGVGEYYITSITSTTFKIHFANQPGAGTWTFYWEAWVL